MFAPQDIIGKSSALITTRFLQPPKTRSSSNTVLIALHHPQQVLPISEFAHKPLGSIAKCLTAVSNFDTAIVTIQPTAGLKWTLGGGVVKVFGSKWLDVPEGRLVDGTKLHIWTYPTNNANQKWGTLCVLFLRASFFISVVGLFLNLSNC